MPTVPVDGRITSLSSLTTIDGSEAMYIVSPGNAAEGNSFQVMPSVIAAYIMALIWADPVVITDGATGSSPYEVQPEDTVILVNKTASEATSILFPEASTMNTLSPVFIKDAKGDAATYNITLSFSSGELCDGATNLFIQVAYGWVTVVPYPGGGSWYQSA